MNQMIEINLLPGQKRKKGGSELALPNLQELFQKVKDPLLVGNVSALVVGGTLGVLIFMAERNTIAELEPRAEALERDMRRYNREITLRRAELDLVDSLRNELARIREIDSDRYVWPHILDEVTRALPDYTWLTSVGFVASAPADPLAAADSLGAGEPPPTIQILGRTSDMAAYTRFLRRLGESPWLTNVVAGTTQLVSEEDRSVVSFSIQVSFRQADSAFIETVPVLSSVQ